MPKPTKFRNPEEVSTRIDALDQRIAEFEERPLRYAPEEIARAGAFVTVDYDGRMRIKRGYVHPEDEAPAMPVEAQGKGAKPTHVEGDEPQEQDGASAQPSVQCAVITIGGGATSAEAEASEDDVLRPLSDRLVTELTQHRSAALRDAVAGEPTIAYFAVLQTLCLNLFYHQPWNSCLELSVRSSSVSILPPDLDTSAYSKAIEARHKHWTARLPKESSELWLALIELHDAQETEALFAHCASLTINVVALAHDPRKPALAHGEELARAVHLDIANAGWRPTAENYFGRVPKARILEAVREAKGDSAAELMAHLKKADMAREAERMLANTDWLPELLRLPGEANDDASGDVETETDESAAVDELPAFLAGDDETAAEPDLDEADTDEVSDFAVAAE